LHKKSPAKTKKLTPGLINCRENGKIKVKIRKAKMKAEKGTGL
jgi:hypothetical protein